MSDPDQATWLVTGGTGFLGHHVVSLLHRSEAGRVTVVGRRGSAGKSGVHFESVELADREAVLALVGRCQPDFVIHAAGRTPPAGAEELYLANVLGTLHLIDALRSLDRPTRLVVVGSAAEVGRVGADGVPVGEDRTCRPEGSYGLSKLLATTAALAASPPLEAISARVFNAIGPGLPPTQAFGRFAADLLAEGIGRRRLEVRDLDSRRDFIDVRDVASALVTLARSGRAGRIYNVGTGKSHSIREGLEGLIAHSGRSADVFAAPSRPGALADSRADIGRITEETSWRPMIPWEQSLSDLWDEARGRALGIDPSGSPP